MFISLSDHNPGNNILNQHLLEYQFQKYAPVKLKKIFVMQRGKIRQVGVLARKKSIDNE